MKTFIKWVLQLLVGALIILGVLFSEDIYALFAIPMVGSFVVVLIGEELK